MCQRNILPLLTKSRRYKSSEIGAILYGRNINGRPYRTQALALMASRCLKYLYENRQIYCYHPYGSEKLWYII